MNNCRLNYSQRLEKADLVEKYFLFRGNENHFSFCSRESRSARHEMKYTVYSIQINSVSSSRLTIFSACDEQREFLFFFFYPPLLSTYFVPSWCHRNLISSSRRMEAVNTPWAGRQAVTGHTIHPSRQFRVSNRSQCMFLNGGRKLE